MIFEGSYFDSKTWIPVKILNIDSYLKKHRSSLHKELVQSSITRLNGFRLFPYNVTVGRSKVSITSTEQAVALIPSLEYALDNYFK